MLSLGLWDSVFFSFLLQCTHGGHDGGDDGSGRALMEGEGGRFAGKLASRCLGTTEEWVVREMQSGGPYLGANSTPTLGHPLPALLGTAPSSLQALLQLSPEVKGTGSSISISAVHLPTLGHDSSRMFEPAVETSGEPTDDLSPYPLNPSTP